MIHLTENEASKIIGGIFKKKKKNKFNARKTNCLSGHLHDSLHEANWCNAYTEDVKQGRYAELIQQKEVVLIKAFTMKNGEKIRKGTIVVDFCIIHNNGQIEMSDAKGVKTDLFKWKWKMLKQKHPEFIYSIV